MRYALPNPILDELVRRPDKNDDSKAGGFDIAKGMTRREGKSINGRRD